MSDPLLLKVNLLEKFDALINNIQNIVQALNADQSYSIWVSRTEAEIEAGFSGRAKAIQLAQTLWYEDGQEGRETITCPGIISASPTTLVVAATCNVAKDEFKQAVLALKSLPKIRADAVLESLHQRDQEVASGLRRFGAARLNLKQAYRHLPILEQRPQKIGFTWSKQGRTIQRTSVAEARRLLERRTSSAQAQLELERLTTIPEDEVLARVRSVRPHLRANIVFDQGDGAVERRLMQAPLPILIPGSRDSSLPDFVPIPPTPTEGRRLRRSDVRIEDEVFLPLIRIHRYKSMYR